jgi:hypothetical protein
MSANHVLLIIVIGIAVVLTAGCTQPAVETWERSWAIAVYSEGDRLFYDSVMPGDKKVELFSMGNDTFFVTSESNDAFIFTRDASGKINGLKMYTMDGSYDESEKVS